MFSNEKYKGSVRLLDSVTGDVEYLAKENNPLIINDEVFDRVQKEKAKGRNVFKSDDGTTRKNSKNCSKKGWEFMLGMLIRNTRRKTTDCDYHLKNIEILFFDKRATINYLRILTDSVLTQQLGYCIGDEMPNLNLHENSNNIPSYYDYTKAFGETLETPSYDVDQLGFSIDLSIDPVISCIWNIGRVESALKNIGDGCISPYSNNENIFKYDKLNHYVTHIYPLGINIVSNGNHSIFSGLIKRKGFVKITSIIDVSDSILASQCLEEIKEIRTIKEISRLMKKRNIDYVYPEIVQYLQEQNLIKKNEY